MLTELFFHRKGDDAPAEDAVAADGEEEGEKAEDGEAAEPPPPAFPSLTLDTLKEKCAKLEPRYLELLHSQWMEIQDPYIESCKLALQR